MKLIALIFLLVPVCATGQQGFTRKRVMEVIKEAARIYQQAFDMGQQSDETPAGAQDSPEAQII